MEMFDPSDLFLNIMQTGQANIHPHFTKLYIMIKYVGTDLGWYLILE